MLVVAVILGVLSIIVTTNTNLWQSRAAIAASTNDLEALGAKMEELRSTTPTYDTAQMRAGPWSKNVYFVAGMGDAGKWSAVVGNRDMRGLCGIVAGRSRGVAITTCPRKATLPFAASTPTPSMGQTVTFNASAALAMVAQARSLRPNQWGPEALYGQVGGKGAQMISWDFGDGTGMGGDPLTYAQVTHTYTTPTNQLRPIKVGIINSRGQLELGFLDPATGMINGGNSTVPSLPGNGPGDLPPTARANVTNSSPEVGSVVTFDGGASTDPDDGIVLYSWSFSNGSTAAGMVVNKIFTTPGTYTGTLTVTDGAGATSSASASVTVVAKNLPPVAIINAPGPVVSRNVSGAFDCLNSSDADGSVVQCQWDFGDGATATGNMVFHTFQAVGQYQVRLTAIDNRGATGTSAVPIKVVPDIPPVAKAVATPTIVNTGQSVSFDGTTSTAPGRILTSWEWRYGDGMTGAGPTSSHIFSTPGMFTYILTVTNNTWSTDSTSGTIRVNNRPPVAGSLSCTPMNTVSGTSVKCSPTGFSDPDGGKLTYSWSMGTGWQQTGSGPQGSSITGYWSLPGAKTVSVTASDGQTSAPNGAQTAAALMAYTVGNSPPQPGTFGCSPTAGAYTGAPVTCTASGWSDLDGGALAYTISFGDGTIALGPTASHIYVTPGTRSIQMNVTDGQGGTATRVVVFSALNRPPTISGVSCSPATAASSTMITCSISALDPDGGTISYRLDVLDSLNTVRSGGSFQASNTVSFAINIAGTFTIKSYVQDNQGSGPVSGPTTSVVLTNTPASKPNAYCTPQAGLDLQTVTCTASGSTDPDGGTISYLWSGAGRTGAAVGSSTTYSWATPGTYSVSVVASDGQGGTSQSSSIMVTATNRDPSFGSFTCSPASIGALGSVSCTATASDPDGGGLTYTANVYTTGWALVSSEPISSTATFPVSMPGSTGSYYIVGYVDDNQGSGWISGPSAIVDVN